MFNHMSTSMSIHTSTHTCTHMSMHMSLHMPGQISNAGTARLRLSSPGNRCISSFNPLDSLSIAFSASILHCQPPIGR